MNIDTSKLYNVYFADTISFGLRTSKSQLNGIFRDGRITSLLMEKIIPNYFSNLTPCENAGSKFDMVMQTGSKKKKHKVEVKVMTKNGLCINQSKTLGVGRSGKQDYTWRESIDYFMFINITTFPMVQVTLVANDQIPEITNKFTINTALELFFDKPEVAVMG